MKSSLSVLGYFNNEHRLLGLMMFSLIAALNLGTDSDFARSFLVSHFGLFLLWQPILKQQQSFSIPNLIILIAFILAFIIWFNLWISAFWMLLLMSLLTGRIFARGLGRAVYGLAVIIIFLELTLIITPSLFNLSGLDFAVHAGLNIALLVLSASLLLTPSMPEHSTHVDFIRGFMVVVLTLFLCMGSVLTTYKTGQPYVQSLAGTVLVAAMFLFALAVVWVPRAGFSGLAQLWERYLLNIGGPFEQWISRLAALEANSHVMPNEFLVTSIRYLLDRHWISGVAWISEQDEQIEGEHSSHQVTVIDPKLRLTLYAHNPVGPALLLHTKLLLSVLTFYYKAKLQEQQLIKQAHLRAIYETGSKLTHDIKNILQSAQTLTQVVSQEDFRTAEAKDMLKKQLPLLEQRLKSTLDKLTAPDNTELNIGPVTTWWEQMQARYTGRYISFEGDIVVDKQIPVDLFDSIIENLLENARTKRIIEENLQIIVIMHCDENLLQIKVCDTGSAIPATISERLFNEVVSSEDGFGIGLYQSHQQAQQHGFTLRLDTNKTGDVCFVLEKSY